MNNKELNVGAGLVSARGITLMSLVITIILMLILAGVVLNLSIGERGIFNTAKSTKDIQRIAEYKDYVEISRTGVAVDNLGKVTLDNLIEEIYKDKIVPEGSIRKLDEEKAQMITEEGYIFIITADGIEYIDKKENIPNPDLKEGDLVINEPTWDSNTHRASVTITKGNSVASGLSIQYQVNSTTGTWNTGTNVSNLSLNDTIYARLWNGIEGGSYTSLKITEKTAPTVTVNITGTSTNSITASVSAQDNQAGMPNSPTYTFYIKKTSEEDSTYVQKQSSTSITCTFTELAQNTSYTVKVTTKDIAENIGTGILNVSTEKQLVTGITLNETTKIMDKGTTYTLKATVYPENADNKNITWSSSNTNVATVSNGVITAKDVGITIITATAQDGSGKSASSRVSVCGIPNGTKVSVSSGVNAEYAIDGETNASYYWNANDFKGTITIKFPVLTQTTKVAIYHRGAGHTWNYKVLNDNYVIGQLSNHSGTNGWTEIDVTDGNYTYLNIYGENIGNTSWFALNEIKIYP